MAFQVEGCNLTANSLHPGVIFTNLSRNNGNALYERQRQNSMHS